MPGTLSWHDPSNNKAFLAGDISLTGNGISIYTVAKNSKDPGLVELAKDISHAQYPIGPVGHPTEQNLMLTAIVFKYSKYPNAAKDYLRFMWEGEQFNAWMSASNGYISQPLKAYNDKSGLDRRSEDTRRFGMPQAAASKTATLARSATRRRR